MAEDRARLLRSLSIERPPEPVRRGVAPALVLAIGLLSAAAGGAAVWVLAPGGPGSGDAARPQEPVATADAGAGGVGTSQAKPAGSTPGAPGPVAAGAPAPARPPGELVATGYVTARRVATVSAEISGRLTEVLIEEGQEVADGEVIARLDDDEAQIALRLAQAETNAAAAAIRVLEADLTEARANLARTQSLRGRDFSTARDLDRDQARVGSLVASIAQAQARLAVARVAVEQAQERVDQHIIRAPFAGVVIDKNAQPGEIVAPGSAGGGFTRTGVGTIVDMASLEVEVDVAEENIARVRPGQPATATLNAYPDWRIQAEVIAIIPTASRDRATIRVRVGLRERDARVLPDMAAKVRFQDEQG